MSAADEARRIFQEEHERRSRNEKASEKPAEEVKAKRLWVCAGTCAHGVIAVKAPLSCYVCKGKMILPSQKVAQDAYCGGK